MTERTPFELATAELRKLGITLRQLPGECSVNFRDGSDATTTRPRHWTKHLRSARQWPQRSRAAGASRGRRSRRPLRMTPKAVRRRMIRQHNRRMRARAKHRDDQ